MSDHDELGQTTPSLEAPASKSRPPPGEQLPFEPPGRYQNLNAPELGRGGLGRVVLVRDAHLERDVAVKEIHPQFKDRDDAMGRGVAERFLREARITASLEHPGVVPIYELGKRNDGSLFYAMKRVQGQTLGRALAACATLDDRLSLLPHLLDVVQTLAYAHSRGVTHRDLKPDNVMVGAFGETQVLDWGLARTRQTADVALVQGAAADPAPATQTLAGHALGTPLYMSPEQARGEVDKMDAQSDVWSLGVMLFELLTGRTPFQGADHKAVLDQVRDGPVLRASEFGRVPAALAAVAEKAMQRERSFRYPSAVEMADALAAATGAHAKASARPWGWIAATLSFGAVVFVLSGYVFSTLGNEAGHEKAQLRLKQLRDRELAAEVAERAQTAWENGKALEASQLTTRALSYAADPLARGVQRLAELARAPAEALAAPVAPAAAGPAPIRALAFSADGTRAAWSRDDGSLVLWSLASGKELAHDAGSRANALAFSADGKTLAVGRDDKAILLLDAETGKQLDWLRDHIAPVTALAWSPDGRLASGGSDHQVLLWKVASFRANPVWTPSRSLEGVAARVTALAFSEDGARLAAGLDDGKVLQWGTENRLELELRPRKGPVRAVGFGKDGQVRFLTTAAP